MGRHVYRCPLRWADMDAYGHVNNVEFLRYLEEARIDFMFRLASGEGAVSGEAASFQGGSVVARHEIEYRRQLVHRYEPVTIELWVTEVRAASARLAYEVKDDGDDGAVYVRASTVIVPYDFDAGRPRRITAEERTFLEKYLEPTGPGTEPEKAAAA